jgi:hypothetical protein
MHPFLCHPLQWVRRNSAAALRGLLFCLMTGLSACTPLTETTLTPSVGTWFLRGGYDWNFYCGLSTVGQAPSFTPGRGSVLVGFENYFDEGSGLFPCQASHDIAYRGAVLFNLDGLRNVVAATLTFGWEWTSKSGPGTSANSAAQRLYLRTGDNVFYQADPLLDLSPGDHSFSIDVSTVVRNWVIGITENRGFVISGPNDFPENNDTWVSSYNNLRLHVVYNPM